MLELLESFYRLQLLDSLDYHITECMYHSKLIKTRAYMEYIELL